MVSRSYLDISLAGRIASICETFGRSRILTWKRSWVRAVARVRPSNLVAGYLLPTRHAKVQLKTSGRCSAIAIRTLLLRATATIILDACRAALDDTLKARNHITHRILLLEEFTTQGATLT
jgi:hypothetical protein